VFGLLPPGPLDGRGFGRFDHVISPGGYCGVGAALTAVGAGFLVFGLAGVAPLVRQGPNAVPWRRSLFWAAAVALVLGAAGAGVSFWRARQTPAADPGRESPWVNEASEQGMKVAAAYWNNPSDARLFTDDFNKRSGAHGQDVTYSEGVFTSSSYSLGPNRATVIGRFNAMSKTSRSHVEFGETFTQEKYAQPKDVDYLMRLVKGDDGRWLIDDLEFRER
jgi:hypothetical protein